MATLTTTPIDLSSLVEFLPVTSFVNFGRSGFCVQFLSGDFSELNPEILSAIQKVFEYLNFVVGRAERRNFLFCGVCGLLLCKVISSANK